MGEFSVYSIAEIGKTITGKTPSSNDPEDFGGKTPFVTPSDSFEHKYIEQTERYLSEEGVRKLKGKLLPPDSVLVTCIGSAMGKVAMNRVASITNQQINSIAVSNKYSAHYICYVLKNSYKQLRNAATGSTALPLLSKRDFDLLSIRIHNDKFVQKKIANVLSTLDAKIELNNRINAELEALAKTIYDYWFVQFGFPDAHGRSYRSSGGAMVWNDTLKRNIPAGWDVDLLGNVVENLDSKRVPLSKKQREERFGDIPYYGATGLMGYVDVPLFDEELLLLAEDGSVMDDHGRVVLQRIWGKAWVNNHAHVLRPSGGWTVDLLYHALRNIPAIRMMSGSIQKKITQDNLNATLMLVPPATIRHSLAQILLPLRERQKRATEESAELTRLRDWLLPLLMNGQVRVAGDAPQAGKSVDAIESG